MPQRLRDERDRSAVVDRMACMGMPEPVCGSGFVHPCPVCGPLDQVIDLPLLDAEDACLPFAPTRFSRRGPGLRSGVKPDLAHVGGSGTQHTALGHGLFSILPDGTVIDGCGTSYASPLVAKTAAVLDHAIEGEVSRETLIGLLVHHAELPEPLRPKALGAVARHLVGFGMPPSAERILETGDHSIMLVYIGPF